MPQGKDQLSARPDVAWRDLGWRSPTYNDTGEGTDMESRERPAESGMVGLVDMSVDTLRELWDRGSDQQLDEALRRVTEPAGENAHAAVSAFNSHI
ncbi:hypothetical protein ACFQX7_37980 [Luedemannella flava]